MPRFDMGIHNYSALQQSESRQYTGDWRVTAKLCEVLGKYRSKQQ
jgi:hypothetical protein